jgi:hypothetical protein
MNPPIDFDRLQRILEKCERGEPLSSEVREYGEIFHALKSKSESPVKIDADFRSGLKSELLETYDETYPVRRPFFSKYSLPYFRLALSFCLLLTVGFGMYGWLGSPVKNSETHQATYAPAILSEETRSIPNPSPGMSPGAPAFDQTMEKSESSKSISDSASIPQRNMGSTFGSIGGRMDVSNGSAASDSLK